MFIPIVLGTARVGAHSPKVADYVLKKALEFGFESELVRPGDHIDAKTYRLSDGNPKAGNWKKIVAKADGFIFVIPEYNHSFPGELKILLDILYKEYYGKVAGLIGVSGGGLGGARVVEHIKPVMTNFGMYITQKVVLFSGVRDLFNEDGSITDESYDEKLLGLFEEIKMNGEKLSK